MENPTMFAELLNGVTQSMREDPLVVIISDAGVFLVTPKSNTSLYPELSFEIACEEALEAYNIKL